MEKNNNALKYIITVVLTLVIVLSGFFMPEITEKFNESKLSYSYETNKTSYSVQESVPYAMRFTETFSEAEYYGGSTAIDSSGAKEAAESFFYSISPWKYGCDLSFIDAVPYLCSVSSITNKAVVWKTEFYSVALNSNLTFLVSDDASMVIGFNVYNRNTDNGGVRYLLNDYQYYVEKYLPSLCNYYKWSMAYSSMESMLSGVINFKIAFVDKDGNSASVMLYYDYHHDNVIFNMEENIIDFYRYNESEQN